LCRQILFAQFASVTQLLQNASRELPDLQVSRSRVGYDCPYQHCSWDIFSLCLRLRYAFDCALIVFFHLSSHRLYSDAIGCTQDFFSSCKASIHSKITEVQLPFCAPSIVELLLESISLLEITSSLVKSMDCIPATCSLCL
jgi:hypothetical protein